MPFPPPKTKKPGLAIGIMVGKPKPKDDLDAPEPLGGSAAHEASESPTEESGEEYGQKLISDIEAVGEQYGADAATSHAMAAAFLEAIAKCLQADKEGGDEGQDDQGMGNVPEGSGMQGGYGR